MTFSATVELLEMVYGRDHAIEICNDVRWKNGAQRVTLNTDNFNEDDLKSFLEYTELNNKALHSKVSTWAILRSKPEGAVVRNLQQLEAALIGFIGEAPHRFVFTEGNDGVMVPWFVADVEFHPAYWERGYKHPAHTDMDLEAIYADDNKNLTVRFDDDDLIGRKKVVSDLLADKDIFRETPEAYDRWKAQLVTWHGYNKLLGVQFSASGFGYAERSERGWSHWKSTKTVSLSRNGAESRVVIDVDGDPDDERDADHKDPKPTQRFSSFWRNHLNGKSKKSKDGENDPDGDIEADADGMNEKEGLFIKPIHPYIQVFSFDADDFVDTCVSNLKPYVYRDNLQDKLILPEAHKKLVTVLIEGASHRMEDIVSGKVGGVIVIATGEPGTGKTLTAEVYSEQIKRPLYVVQCAQLGTDEEELEDKLGTVLGRAGRWGAILLIDEADVYVRARENDLQQNAIVGVFLRLLERFNGVLFMTSNRATAIDDAIMSRAIAHIRYHLPDEKSLKLIWEVLSENYKVDLFPKEIERLVEKFPMISGRNVKTLLKLATAVARKDEYKKGELAELIETVSQFVEFPKAHYQRITERQQNTKKT